MEHHDDMKLTTQQLQNLTNQCIILRACYYSCINDMSTVKSWETIIEQTLDKLSNLGFSIPTNARTVMRWNRLFRKNNSFPHPNPYIQMGKKVKPTLFEVYPEAEEMIHQYASKNLDNLSLESLALHTRETTIPNLFDRYKREELNNNQTPMSKDEFFHCLHLTSISPSTAYR